MQCSLVHLTRGSGGDDEICGEYMQRLTDITCQGITEKLCVCVGGWVGLTSVARLEMKN